MTDAPPPNVTPAASSSPTPSSRGCGCGCGALVLGCLGVIVLVVAGIAAVGVFAWWQWTSTPDYWDARRAQIQQFTPAERDQRAEQVEHRFSAWFSDADDADPATNYAAAEPTESGPAGRSLSVSFEDLNIWLDRRMDAWMQQQEVDIDLPVREVIVASQNGKLVVAADVHMRQFSQVVSAVVDAKMLPDGDMFVHVERVRLGRIPMPTETILRLAREQMPEDEQTDAVKQVLKVFEGTTFTPAYEQLRVTGWTIDDDGIELTVSNGASRPQP